MNNALSQAGSRLKRNWWRLVVMVPMLLISFTWITGHLWAKILFWLACVVIAFEGPRRPPDQ